MRFLPGSSAGPDSCDELKTGSCEVPKEGLRLQQSCTIGAGTNPQVKLHGPLTVHGNLTAQGNVTFRSSHSLGGSRHFKEDGFRLQCLWDGGKAQLAYALASPMAPLVMLPACGLLQVFKPSAGDPARPSRLMQRGRRGAGSRSYAW
ncbi:unnamed protein product [Effrenium voratum]|uniref:Uncharacterized protein n=1 Tax=Effrenium voratum TaxID=2562239 RepID=A0AA36JEI0_9DINO|nr:unnamed protein product [Effrenium voratum]